MHASKFEIICPGAHLLTRKPVAEGFVYIFHVPAAFAIDPNRTRLSYHTEHCHIDRFLAILTLTLLISQHASLYHANHSFCCSRHCLSSSLSSGACVRRSRQSTSFRSLSFPIALPLPLDSMCFAVFLLPPPPLIPHPSPPTSL